MADVILSRPLKDNLQQARSLAALSPYANRARIYRHLAECEEAARPIVATAVGEVPTVLDGGRAGVLAPPRDAAALADGIAGVLSDPAQARRLSAAAALRAAQEYTLATMTERYAALYAELLARGPASTPLVFARA